MRKPVVLVAAFGALALGALAFGALALGSSGQATTYQVLVGEQTRPPAGTPKGTTLNRFFPDRLQITAGDKVTFSSFGFHTVSNLAGQKRPPLIAPDPKAVYEGITDAAGQPFYFEGKPSFVYNLAAFAPSGPTTISGKTAASSGVIVSENEKKPVTVTYAFPKVGTFKLVCNVHPKMELRVTVKPKGAVVPSPEDVAARAKAETEAAWAEAKALHETKTPARTVYMGIGSTTSIIDFLPDVLRVKVGTSVSFVNKAPSEVHNVALGPVKYMEKFSKQTDLFPESPKAKNQVTPVFPYGTDPREAYTYDGSNHGNGFMVTPLTDGVAGALPNASRVTFTKPGRYRFICFLHGPDMRADVIVTK